mmetsp:Transcript_18461/g.26593  ORF Transcript_18461/g.26593 Transcript_18461/m.26593 type:complete len:132 (+) Transcript_18461:666-1061(+)
MAAMLRREQDLRLAETTQILYADPAVDSIALTTQLQLQVVGEFGFPASHVQLLRAAKQLYSREELPLEQLPHYVRFNRSSRGDLRVGSAVPDVPLHWCSSAANPLAGPSSLLEIAAARQQRPLVVVAGSYT